VVLIEKLESTPGSSSNWVGVASNPIGTPNDADPLTPKFGLVNEKVPPMIFDSERGPIVPSVIIVPLTVSVAETVSTSLAG